MASEFRIWPMLSKKSAASCWHATSNHQCSTF